jgi:hypothetical protein
MIARNKLRDWDRNFSQGEIHAAFEKALGDMPRYAAGKERRSASTELPLMAHRDILRRRTNSAARGAKRTLRSLHHAAGFMGTRPSLARQAGLDEKFSTGIITNISRLSDHL